MSGEDQREQTVSRRLFLLWVTSVTDFFFFLWDMLSDQSLAMSIFSDCPLGGVTLLLLIRNMYFRTVTVYPPLRTG